MKQKSNIKSNNLTTKSRTESQKALTNKKDGDRKKRERLKECNNITNKQTKKVIVNTKQKQKKKKTRKPSRILDDDSLQ